jgi:hypothetical protein
MRKKPSVAEQVRRMIDQGHTNKSIIDKLGIKPQIVYNIRYQVNKARGLGAIGAIAPAPAEGIGAPPPKRKYTRRAPAGTGINPAQNAWPYNPPTLQGTTPYMPITMIEKPTLWQRVKGWFRGLYA